MYIMQELNNIWQTLNIKNNNVKQENHNEIDLKLIDKGGGGGMVVKITI